MVGAARQPAISWVNVDSDLFAIPSISVYMYIIISYLMYYNTLFS